MKVCVYSVFNRTFLNREIKSHISEMENVKANAALLTRVNVSSRFDIADSQLSPVFSHWMFMFVIIQPKQIKQFDDMLVGDVLCCLLQQVGKNTQVVNVMQV